MLHDQKRALLLFIRKTQLLITAFFVILPMKKNWIDLNN